MYKIARPFQSSADECVIKTPKICWYKSNQQDGEVEKGADKRLAFKQQGKAAGKCLAVAVLADGLSGFALNFFGLNRVGFYQQRVNQIEYKELRDFCADGVTL